MHDDRARGLRRLKVRPGLNHARPGPTQAAFSRPVRAKVVYDIASNRGVRRHDPDEDDSNELDARAVLAT